MLAYIIFNKNTKEILAIEHTKKAKDCYNPDIFDYTCWDSEDSPYPSMGAEFVETRGYEEIRKAHYKLETDPMLPRVLGQEADGDDTGWALWENARNEIKLKVPKEE